MHMPTANIVDRIRRFNQGREEQRLALKYERMAADPFTFFRGTCHLFYDDLPLEGSFIQAPAVWICGDLHLENFGSYKGDNRLTYFDLNDFDESVLAPLTWEISRFLTSLWLAAEQIGAASEDALDLSQHFLQAYIAEIVRGKARWVERDTAKGMIGQVFTSLQGRRAFLAERTRQHKGRQVLRVIPGKTLPLEEGIKEKLARFLLRFARDQQRARFYRFLDGARRIAGTGSLGIRRYVVLVEGKGPPYGYQLLDFKQAQPSALVPYLPVPQPSWESEAKRVVAIQQRMQAIEPALLQAVAFDKTSWVIRQLQPSQNRLQLRQAGRRSNRLRRAVQTMGQLVAWSHLRSSGRQDAATTDTLGAFAVDKRWSQQLVEYAQIYSQQVEADWNTFCRWQNRSAKTRKD